MMGARNLFIAEDDKRSVEDLSVRTGLTFANTSRHLQILCRAQLVNAERCGKRIIYSLAGESEVTDLIYALGREGERNVAEIDRVMADLFSRPRCDRSRVT